MKPENIIKSSILAMKAYHVPESEGLIKLDANENPYSWPEHIRSEWVSMLEAAELNRYPDADVRQIKQRLSDQNSLPKDIDILFGNGSDELIQILLMALNNESRVVMAPEPTFVMYKATSVVLDLDFVGVPLDENFSIDLPAMLEAIKEKQPALIFLAWPNNPTGIAYDKETVEAIIQHAPGLVIVDEAYHDFAQKTFLSRIQDYENVLVMRTFSKQGLAGLRLGMLFGKSEWINEFNKVRLPYNIGTLNQLSAEFMLNHIEVLEQQVEQIREDRQVLQDALTGMKGLKVWPSEANFILFRTEQKTANELHASLLENKISIKNLHGSHPLLENCLRVTIGTTEENEKFISCMRSIL